MNPTRGFPIALKLLVVVIAAFSLVLFGVRYFTWFHAGSERALDDLQKSPVMPEEPDHIRLNTIPASSVSKQHLLDEDFKIVRRTGDIAESCRDIFYSSFGNSSGSASATNSLALADPGQEFQSSDNIRSGVPFRRLVLAGLGPRTCFIYYEHGGAMYPSACLAIMDYHQTKAVWVGEARKKARTVHELRSMLAAEQFADTAGPVC
jgi:hypothetical protein